MKSLNFKQSSWHYKLAESVGYFPDMTDDGKEVGDICKYTRAILVACLAGLVCAAVFAGVSFLVIEVIFGLAFSWWYGVWLMSYWGEVTLVVAVAVGVAGTPVYAGIKIAEWIKRRKWVNEDKPDGFVKHAYKSWKEKYCARITFTD